MISLSVNLFKGSFQLDLVMLFLFLSGRKWSSCLFKRRNQRRYFISGHLDRCNYIDNHKYLQSINTLVIIIAAHRKKNYNSVYNYTMIVFKNKKYMKVYKKIYFKI